MYRQALLQEMRELVGNKEPIRFFERMVDVLDLLFDRIDELESSLEEVKRTAALAIEWEPKIARSMIAEQINTLRNDSNGDAGQISQLSTAFLEDVVTLSYRDFCRFWEDTLGYHPFDRS